MTFDKELNKKGLGELYYGKENLMGEGVTRFISPEEVERNKKKMEFEKNQEGVRPMVNDAKVKKVKPKRFHVDLSPEQGESFTELAEKMGLTLNAVVKLFLMKPWKEYQYYGYDYIYLGVASKPMDEPSYK